jgi:hypothetical protein
MATIQNVSTTGAGNQVVGKVVILYGTVKAISPDGTVRLLAPNSPIFANDQIVTESDGRVSIMFDGAPPSQMDLGRMSSVVIDEDVYAGSTSTPASDVTADIEEIQKALLAGDESIELEAPAAGGGGAGGGRKIFVLDPTGAEVTPTSGAETIGVTYGALETVVGTFDQPVAPPEITITLTGLVSVDEGGEITYTANLSQAAEGAIEVTLSNGSIITIPAGATSGTVTVPAPSDDVYIDAETVTTIITGATGSGSETFVIDTSPAITDIPDTIDITTVSLSAVNVTENDPGVTFTATLSNPGQTDVTITTNLGTITIPAGQTVGTLFVNTADPDVYIDPSSITATVSEVSGGNFEDVDFSSATVTAQITDTIDVTTVSLSGPSAVNEGNAAIYTVTVDHAPQTDMTVDLTYTYLTASSDDIVTNTIQVTIAAGQSSAQFSVGTVDDQIVEGSELYSVSISNPQGGNFENLVIGNGTVQTAILDNDVPVIDVAGIETQDVTVTEGQDAVFTVNVTGAAVGSTVTLTLADGTAINADYNEAYFQYSTDNGATWNDVTGAISVQAGDSTLLVKTDTYDDMVDESNETFTLTGVLNSNGTDYSDSATATIIDNDVPVINVAGIETQDVTVTEGQDAIFTVAITKAAAGSTVTLTLADGTAIDADYNEAYFQYSTDNGATWNDVTGAISVQAGDSTLLVKTDTYDDMVDESNETFTLTGVLNSNGTDYSDSATATIIDNDVPVINVAGIETQDVTVTEGQDAIFTVAITKAAAGSTVTLTLADGTAIDADYNEAYFQYSTDNGATWNDVTGAISVAAGDSSLLVKTDTYQDLIDEADETFTLTGVLNSNGTDYSDTATATILDNDEPLIATPDSDVTVYESDLDLFMTGDDLAAGTATGTTPSSKGETDKVNTLVGSVSGGAGDYIYTLLGSSTGNYGVIDLNSDGTYTYTLTTPVTSTFANNGANTEVRESFTYMVTDAAGQTAQSTISVNIVDDVPVLSTTNGIFQNSPNTLLEGTLATIGADMAGSITLSGTPPAGLTSLGQPVTYTVDGSVIHAMAGGDEVFTLTGNPDGTYTFVQHQVLDLSVLSSDLQSTVGASGPQPTYFMYTDGAFGSDASIPWSIAITSSAGHNINPSTQGMGVDNNLFQTGETMHFEFDDEGASGAANLAYQVKVGINGLGTGESVSWSAHFTDGSTLSDVAFSSDLVNGQLMITAPGNNVHFDYIDFTANAATSVRLTAVTAYTLDTSITKTLDFGFTATDADGDQVAGTFSLLAQNAATLTGGEDNDALGGNSGINILNGGVGDDILTGGEGTDTFKVGLGNDTIKDFTVGTDKLVIEPTHTDVIFNQSGNTVNLTVMNGASQVGTITLENMPTVDLNTLLPDDPHPHG